MIELTHLEKRAISYLNFKGEVTEEQLKLVQSGINEVKRFSCPQFAVRFLKLEENMDGHLFVDAPINLCRNFLEQRIPTAFVFLFQLWALLSIREFQNLRILIQAR